MPCPAPTASSTSCASSPTAASTGPRTSRAASASRSARSTATWTRWSPPASPSRASGAWATPPPPPITLPPLNLSLPELEALHLGLAVVGEAGDEELKEAARTPLGQGRRGPARGPLRPRRRLRLRDPRLRRGLARVPPHAGRSARRSGRARSSASRSRATPSPAGSCARSGSTTGAASGPSPCWARRRAPSPLLRVDLIEEVAALPQLFVDEPGRTLADYQADPGLTVAREDEAAVAPEHQPERRPGLGQEHPGHMRLQHRARRSPCGTPRGSRTP